MDLTSLDFRELLFLLLAVAAVFAVFTALRLKRLARTPPPKPVVESAAAAAVAEQRFADQQRMAMIEREVTNLRDALAASREDHEALRQEIASLRAEIGNQHEEAQAMLARETARLRAAQPVSPLYGEAMQLALAGHGAADIADRCSIAVGEADLLVSLAQSRLGEEGHG